MENCYITVAKGGFNMNDLNVITLTGEIASDIKRGTTKNNQPYAIFRLHSKGYRELYISISCFGTMAEIAANLNKGDRIYVEGELQRSTFEKNGNKVIDYSVVANIIDLESNMDYAGREKKLNNAELEEI